MWSLSVRLFRHLLVGQLLIILLVIVIAAASLLIAATEYFQTRLEHDRDLLMQELHWDDGQLDVHAGILPPIFITPLSGHYFQVNWQAQTLLSPSLSPHHLPETDVFPTQEHWSWESFEQDQHLYVLTQVLHVRGQQVVVRIAEDMLPVVTLFTQALMNLVLFLLVAVGLVFVWQRHQMRMALKPFEHVRLELRQLGQQEIECLGTPKMKELIPLVDEINQLGERMQERLMRARLASGNLSHSLKTPLAILNNRLDELTGDADNLAEAKAQIQHINRLIDNEMKRARIAGLMSQAPQLDLVSVLKELTLGLGKLYPGIRIQLNVPESFNYPGDREDMFELLGNVLDNACKWARSRVVISVSLDGGDWLIGIEDDGAGVPEEQRSRLHRPGLRLDETTEGYGLGLAIVADIVSQYQGHLRFEGSEALGGLKVDVRLPR